jgi:lipid II:glycine glycyltransferase (peptidoglycan interpeptide bridge formation enzyme)
VKGPFGGKHVVSMPFSDYCGMILDDDEDRAALAEHLVGLLGRRCAYLEIRGGMLPPPGWRLLSVYKRHVIELDRDAEAVYKRFNRKTIQYSIRKAVKDGIEIVTDRSMGAVEEFHRLNVRTRKKHGVPSQPLEFFRNLQENMCSGGLAYVMLARRRGTVLAGGLFFRLGDTVYYKYNASDPDCLKTYTPNHLLAWHGIETACREGYRRFDFGRTSIRNAGLMRYKEMWGATASDLPYYYFPEVHGIQANGENAAYGWMKRMWKHLPDRVAETASRYLFRYTA